MLIRICRRAHEQERARESSCELTADVDSQESPRGQRTQMFILTLIRSGSDAFWVMVRARVRA